MCQIFFLGNSNPCLVVVVSSDRGLCGGFNSNVVKLAKSVADDVHGSKKDVNMLCIGKKALSPLSHSPNISKIDHLDIPSGFGFEFAAEVASTILQKFADKEFGSCYICYTAFQTALVQKPTVFRLVPFAPHEGWQSENSPIETEPSRNEVLNSVVMEYISFNLYSFLLESITSEHAARMTAMDSATKNASEMVDSLTLRYNKIRQARITAELIEVISGADALSGG